MGAGVVGISMTKFSGGVKLGAGDMLPTPAVLWNDPRDGNVVTGPDGKGNGVAGWSNTGAGVFGVSEQKFGVVGRCRIGNGFGVVGIQGEPARKSPFVVTGDVTGDNAHPAGVHGHNYGTGSGVSGFSVSGYGGVFQSNTVAQLRLVQLDLALLNPLGPPSPSGDPNGVVIGQPGDLLVTLAPARQALPPQAVLWFCKRVETSHPKGVWVQIA